MRISCFFVLAAAAAGVVASGNALATVDSTKMTPAHAIKAVQSDGDPTKRLLRVVERDDEEYDDSKEERTNFNWSTLKSLFPGTARRAANEESKMSTLASKFAVYKSDDWMPLDVYTLMRKTMSHQKAMKYGLRYEKYLESAR